MWTQNLCPIFQGLHPGAASAHSQELPHHHLWSLDLALSVLSIFSLHNLFSFLYTLTICCVCFYISLNILLLVRDHLGSVLCFAGDIHIYSFIF